METGMEAKKQGYRVLLADDHAVIRNGVRQMLAGTTGFGEVGEAANGHEVLQQVRQRDWDVVVLDISMPGRSGLELIRLIKDEKPELPTLVFSMHQEEQYAMRALHAGAAGYVTKESDCETLLEAIRRVAGGGVYLTSKATELVVRGVRPAGERLPHEVLSDREYQVFNYVVAGHGLTEIADRLSLSVKTISTHKTHILAKMGFANLAELIRYAVSRGLVVAPEM
jgi:two-component system, NarL family, invasion response regulator UvrY